MIYQVEGQIDSIIDESSSSDDNEDNRSVNSYKDNHLIHNHYVEGEEGNDDKDEVEYFGDQLSINRYDSATKKQSRVRQTKSEEEPKKHLVSFLNINDNTQDEFGIKYKSYRPLLDVINSNNNMLNVTDEYSEEISIKLLASHNNTNKVSELNNNSIQKISTVVKDDDDEFNIINDEYDLITTDQQSNIDSNKITYIKIENDLAIKRALESAANSYNIQDTTITDYSHSDIVLELRNNISLPVQDIPISSSTITHASSEDTHVTAAGVTGEKVSILEEARKAFREISEVYGNGLGDQEVLMLPTRSNCTTTDNTTATTATASKQQIILSNSIDLMRGIHIIIEEGDEDAIDDEEQYMNKKESEEIEKYLQTQIALESEWNDVSAATLLAQSPCSKEELCSAASFATTEHANIHPSINTTTSLNTTSNNDELPPISVIDHTLLPILTSSLSSSSLLITTTTYSAALAYFQSLDLRIYLPNICTTEPVAKSSWFSTNSCPTAINYPGSSVDLALPFLIAQVDYEYSNMQHRCMLNSIYHILINSNYDNNNNNSNIVAAIGNHWEYIGFQGMDPRTDLNRSMKILSILQVLFLIENDLPMIQNAFNESQSNHTNIHTTSTTINTTNINNNTRINNNIYQNNKIATTSSGLKTKERNLIANDDVSWPFMCVSIMFTKESLQVLRKGYLNEKCNKKQNVFNVLNDFYKACFLEFRSLLKEKPLIHHAIHLSTIRKQCESATNTLKLLQKYKYHQCSKVITNGSIQTHNTSQLYNSNNTTTIIINSNTSTTNNNTISCNNNNNQTLEKEIEFDNLDKLEDISSQDHTCTNTTNTSIINWLNMFGSSSNNDRSAKFKVSDDTNT